MIELLVVIAIIAILDRLVHNAYRLELKGESLRKSKAALTPSGKTPSD